MLEWKPLEPRKVAKTFFLLEEICSDNISSLLAILNPSAGSVGNLRHSSALMSLLRKWMVLNHMNIKNIIESWN